MNPGQFTKNPVTTQEISLSIVPLFGYSARGLNKKLVKMNDIKDYFLIGDFHTAALVSRQGSIDWLCCPDFDSPSVFARILDEEGGHFSIETDGIQIRSRYINNTAIVEYQLRKEENICLIRDFMLPQPKNICGIHLLIRKIIGTKGSLAVRFYFAPRPDYARGTISFDKKEKLLTADLNNHQLHLHLPGYAKVIKRNKGYIVEIKIMENQEKSLILEYKTKQSECDYRSDHEPETLKFWESWVSKGRFIEFCRQQMIRSAITLKLSQYYPTGALVAAPTTSLPEAIGGNRNWDYRYVWIRDATFTLYAFHILGYEKELLKFFDFIEDVAEGCRQCGGGVIHLMYTVKGAHVPAEKEIKHLRGFKDSCPVRIGNDAFNQFQLDIYGSLIDAYYFMWRRNHVKPSVRTRDIIISLVEHIKNVWERKDDGIWEMRSGRNHYTYSKVMAWVGVNRALRMSRALNISKENRKEWSILSKKINKWIWNNCFNKDIGSFTQHPDTHNQDATNLLFVLLQFLNRHDELTEKIINNTCKELLYKKIFVYRYLSDDGLKGKEGSFILCSFWLIAALAAVEKTNEAMEKYYQLKKYLDNDMPMSEEIDPVGGEYLGNFPQSFSHMGLILAAFYINKYKERQYKK